MGKVKEEAEMWKRELEEARKKLAKAKEEEDQTEEFLGKFKEEYQRLTEENTSIRQELGRRGDIISTLKKVIEEAKRANESYS